MILKVKRASFTGIVFCVALLIFNNFPSLSLNGWMCYAHPVPGWIPCVCTHNPGEPLCFWSSEPTCSPCDPSTICHVARPGEGCSVEKEYVDWANRATTQNFKKLCDGLADD